MPTPTIKRTLFGGASVRFVNSGVFEQGATATDPVTFPTGAREGDLLVVLWENITDGIPNTPPSLPNGSRNFSTVYYNLKVAGVFNIGLYYAVLTAADIATGTFTPGGNANVDAQYIMLIYRGPKALSTSYVAVNAASAATSVDLTALTLGSSPGGATAGVLAIVTTEIGVSTTPTTAAGWTTRIADPAFGSGYFHWSAFDIRPNSYPGGTVTFSPFSGSGTPFGTLVEMQF
jgi:hypothetical protein